MDHILKAALQKRDADAGIGGKCNFNIYCNNLLVFRICGLTKQKARELFDLADEHNHVNSVLIPHTQIKIEITENNKQIDYNILPNVFTVFFKEK
jgi:hypothetical protein